MGKLLTLVWGKGDKDKVDNEVSLTRKSLFPLILKRLGLNAFGNTDESDGREFHIFAVRIIKVFGNA